MPWKTWVATSQGISRPDYDTSPRWCHSMEKLSALMALCEENTPVNHDSSYKWPVVWSFDVFFIVSLNILFESQTVYWLVKWNASMLIWYHLKCIRYRPVLSTARPENNIVPFTCCSSIQTSEYMWEKRISVMYYIFLCGFCTQRLAKYCGREFYWATFGMLCVKMTLLYLLMQVGGWIYHLWKYHISELFVTV